MPVSLREDIQIDCLACGQPFVADVWSIVDAAERPDLADALLDGTLDAAACPHCAAANQSQVALLYHDPAAKRLNFAAPAYVEEYRWRDRAQQLIAALGSQLPDEAQLPYLNDIDLNQGIESLRRAVQRRQRGRGTGKQPSFGKPIPLPGSGASLALSPQPSALSPQPSVLNDEIELVMAVSSLDELRAVVLRHPQLLSDQADLLLRGLADTAFNDGDRDLSTALHTARTALADLRAGREVVLAPHTPTDAAGEAPVRPALAEQSYQSLLHTASDAALMEVVRLFPALLEPWADHNLGLRTEAALEEGNERLATLIEDRRDALAGLRLALTEPDVFERALLNLLAAADTDAIEQVMGANPALLTDDALVALASYAEAARARGDEAGAAAAAERQAVLTQVRAAIN